MSQQHSRSAFLEIVAEWLTGGSEVLLLIRYSHAAGNKAWHLLESSESLTELLEPLEPLTSVVAVRAPHLPIRQNASVEALAAFMQSHPKDTEYLIIVGDSHSPETVRFSDSPDEVIAYFNEAQGKPVTLGVMPEWWTDTPSVLEFIVPTANGSTSGGAY